MDHARRMFVDAHKAQPKGKNVKVSKAGVALNNINKLYRVERQSADLREKQPKIAIEDIVAYLQGPSGPLLDELKAFLEKSLCKCPKDSLTYKVINHTLNQWSKMVVYAFHHELRIIYIMAENAIRPFVVGRKAWLFADISQGVKASAACYSLVETAKLKGLEPYSYLHTLLT
jgi:hypothetical protein